jgi:hypothetical protein
LEDADADRILFLGVVVMLNGGDIDDAVVDVVIVTAAVTARIMQEVTVSRGLEGLPVVVACAVALIVTVMIDAMLDCGWQTTFVNYDFDTTYRYCNN